MPEAAPATAVVFAYHNVGVRCLQVLLDAGVDVKLVVTHTDNPKETIWFDSVADLALSRNIPTLTMDDATNGSAKALPLDAEGGPEGTLDRPKARQSNIREVIGEVVAASPDFLFSFYYRQMLGPDILAIPKRGAFNMHGSLLPRYRGRVPINWAIIKGETETGATLHEMVTKPDAGRIVAQQAVSIGPDETAVEVFHKVTDAAAAVLAHSLQGLIDGSAELIEQDLKAGSYYGGRKPEDGVIDWSKSAKDIHNLVRAVAPPYPGATSAVMGQPINIHRTALAPAHFKHHKPGFINVSTGRCIALCGDGCMLRILEAEYAGKVLDEAALAAALGVGVHPLG
ncbi:MAG: formyltransferase [Burkholderiales bacterium]|nr:formyltransferase [Burkholderiales bacterium]